MVMIKAIIENIAKEFSNKNLSELQDLIKEKIITFNKEVDNQFYKIEIELVGLGKEDMEIVVSAWPEVEKKKIINSTDSYYLKFKITK